MVGLLNINTKKGTEHGSVPIKCDKLAHYHVILIFVPSYGTAEIYRVNRKHSFTIGDVHSWHHQIDDDPVTQLTL